MQAATLIGDHKPMKEARKEDETLSLELPDGDTTLLRVRRSARARRVSLHMVPGRQQAELVIPHRASMKAGLRFARDQAGWIAQRLSRVPAPVPFEDGATIPHLDRDLTIVHSEGRLRHIGRDGDALHITAAAKDVTRLVTNWLRSEAKREFSIRAEEKAGQLGQSFGRVTVRDTRSRWGSCSARGNLSFSWRLIMAPEIVVDYMAAHEVAHLVEMNHSPRFWKLVDDIALDVKRGQSWLSRNGAGLHRYGLARL